MLVYYYLITDIFIYNYKGTYNEFVVGILTLKHEAVTLIIELEFQFYSGKNGITPLSHDCSSFFYTRTQSSFPSQALKAFISFYMQNLSCSRFSLEALIDSLYQN